MREELAQGKSRNKDAEIPLDGGVEEQERRYRALVEALTEEACKLEGDLTAARDKAEASYVAMNE